MKQFLYLFLLIFIVHGVWEFLNDTPPIWDMAYHRLKGWKYLEAWRQGHLIEQFSQLSSYYPPLYYLQEALILRLAPGTQFLALASNLPGLFLLAYSTFRLSGLYLTSSAALLAGLIPLLFPLVAWTSRVSLLDVTLSGWVAAGSYLILRSNLLQKKRWTLLLGAVTAAGMLTKWTFILFLFPLLLYAIVYSENRRRSAINLADALILAILPLLWWYLPNLISLRERFQATAQVASLEGDPGLGSLLAWIYYPRCLSSYYLYLPLTILFVFGLLLCIFNKIPTRSPLSFLFWWLAGDILLLTLLEAKDPRYAMPLAAPLSILLVYPWQRRRKWVVSIWAFAFAQYLSVSLPWTAAPIKIAWFDIENDQDYRGIRQEWVFYQSTYFGILGTPRRESWRYEEILQAVPEKARIAFLPELAHFNLNTLELCAIRKGHPLEMVRLGRSQDSSSVLQEVSYVIGKTGPQGISYLTRFNDSVYHQLEEQSWSLLKVWMLPDRSQALLWRNPTRSQ